MVLEIRQVEDLREIYKYYCGIKSAVPYWFDVDYPLWLESFADDTDYDGEKMFSQLFTYAAYDADRIVGFVQFGISRYVYDSSGEKNRDQSCGVIRALYFSSEYDCGDNLIAAAEKYFVQQRLTAKAAFFHALGMTCNAGHGKLFCGLPHIEAALLRTGYVKEHENVYYKRMLTENDKPDNKVTAVYGGINPKGLQEFTVSADGKPVGAGALVYLPQGGICYLKWIYIYDAEQGKGYASSALCNIFADLYRDGIRRLDTDTADGNIIAQRLYEKVGFTDMGHTRSYLKQF